MISMNDATDYAELAAKAAQVTAAAHASTATGLSAAADRTDAAAAHLRAQIVAERCGLTKAAQEHRAACQRLTSEAEELRRRAVPNRRTPSPKTRRASSPEGCGHNGHEDQLCTECAPY